MPDGGAIVSSYFPESPYLASVQRKAIGPESMFHAPPDTVNFVLLKVGVCAGRAAFRSLRDFGTLFGYYSPALCQIDRRGR
jgi:hypothetical protein